MSADTSVYDSDSTLLDVVQCETPLLMEKNEDFLKNKVRYLRQKINMVLHNY